MPVAAARAAAHLASAKHKLVGLVGDRGVAEALPLVAAREPYSQRQRPLLWARTLAAGTLGKCASRRSPTC